MAALSDHSFVPVDEHRVDDTTIHLQDYNNHTRPLTSTRNCTCRLGCFQDPDELYFFILIVIKKRRYKFPLHNIFIVICDL